MRRKYGSGIAVTASTGIAACNIGGLTLHSFAGIGLGHDSVEKLVKRILSMKQVYRRWTSISVLVIDESKCCVVTKCYGLYLKGLTKAKPLFSFHDRWWLIRQTGTNCAASQKEYESLWWHSG